MTLCRAQAARPACPHVLTPLPAEITALLTHTPPQTMRPFGRLEYADDSRPPIPLRQLPRTRVKINTLARCPTRPTHTHAKKTCGARAYAPDLGSESALRKGARAMAKQSKRSVYLLCLARTLAHARHYTGSSNDVDRRLQEHRSGRGSKFTQAVVRAGIELRLAAVWPGERYDERVRKNSRNAARHCPFCREDFL